MPEDVTIKIQTTGALESADAMAGVEDAMKSIQATAQQTSAATLDMVPADQVQDLDALGKSALTARQGIGLLTMGMGQSGIAMRLMRTTLYATAISGGTLTGSIHGITAAIKGLMVSIGPIGWALMAIVAIVGIVTWAWNRHKKVLEENKKMMEDYANTEKESRRSMEQLTIRRLELLGRENEALKRRAKITARDALIDVQKRMQTEADIAEKKSKLTNEEITAVQMKAYKEGPLVGMDHYVAEQLRKAQEEKTNVARLAVMKKFAPEAQSIGAIRDLEIAKIGEKQPGFSGLADMWKRMASGMTTEDKVLKTNQDQLNEAKIQTHHLATIAANMFKRLGMPVPGAVITLGED